MDKSIKLYDSVKTRDKSLLEGQVKIYKNNKLIVNKNNKIVIAGRNYLMQRLFGLPYELGSNEKHAWLPRWFSVGSGGATDTTPFQPIWPTDEDTSLYTTLVLNSEGGAGYADSGNKKLIDSVEFSSVLTAKLTMTVADDDAVDSYINEAGMFVSPTDSTAETNFSLFSHVTFPTIPKSSMDNLIIEWFFIF
jgi:hypothetical protein